MTRPRLIMTSNRSERSISHSGQNLLGKGREDRYAGSEAGFSSEAGLEGQRGATVSLVFSLNFFNAALPDAAGGGERSRAAGGGEDLGSHPLTRGDQGIRRELRFRTDPAAPSPRGATSPQHTWPPEPHLPRHEALKPLSPRAAGASG